MGDDRSWDSFMINEYKIRMCDPDRRRDPNGYVYSFQRCPDFLNGCPRGDTCPFAHGYLETWWFNPYIFALNCQQIYYPVFHTYEDPSRLILNQPATFPHHNSVLQGSSSSFAAYTNQWPRFGDYFAQGSSSSVLYRNLQPTISYGHEFPAFQSTLPPPPPPPPMNMMQQPNSQTSSWLPLLPPMMPLPILQIPSLPPPPPMMQQPNSQTPSRPPQTSFMMQLPNSHIPSMPPSALMMQQPYSQTPSMPPPPVSPVMQPPNSQTWMIVRREERPQISQFGTVPPQPRLDPIARPPRATIGVQHQQPQSVLAPFPTDLSRAITHLQADAASLKDARSKRKHDDEAGSSNK
ncbi:hypothetical protein C2S53_018754 [Perilla frutescens var. hirtella]|uniref:C3H1-type domain-containing protein n=1 Tax=Perilla frutescens var. hirtella TaxID=608512 RepID=A0AAD4J129_PERFH|nr:hypothetical protein C2S53_018754 [Perilla frutescens var. hirtella]